MFFVTVYGVSFFVLIFLFLFYKSVFWVFYVCVSVRVQTRIEEE